MAANIALPVAAMENAACFVRNYFPQKLYEIWIHAMTPRLRDVVGSLEPGKTHQVTAPGIRRL